MILVRKKVAALLLCAAMTAAAAGCGKKTESYSHTDFAMGTVTNVTLYGNGTDLEKQEKYLIEKVRKLEKEQISWRVKESNLSKINREIAETGSAKVEEPLKNWIADAVKLSKDSYGEGRNTVDPTIGSLTGLWDFESEHPKTPSEEAIKNVISKDLARSSSHIKINKRGEMKAPNRSTKFDLGAYGKGIGIDEIKKLLEKEEGITGAMAALGGSILVYGEKPNGEPWNVGVQNPSGKDGEVLGGLKLEGDTAISTSGDYEKYYIDKKTGKKYFHILDSKTGYPVETEITSCTIVCKSGIDSDGLSTACFALGVDKSRELLKKYHARAIFVDKKKNIYISEGLDFDLQDESYKIKRKI